MEGQKPALPAKPPLPVSHGRICSQPADGNHSDTVFSAEKRSKSRPEPAPLVGIQAPLPSLCTVHVLTETAAVISSLSNDY